MKKQKKYILKVEIVLGLIFIILLLTNYILNQKEENHTMMKPIKNLIFYFKQ